MVLGNRDAVDWKGAACNKLMDTSHREESRSFLSFQVTWVPLLPQEPFLSTNHEDAPSGLVNEQHTEMLI